MARDAALVSFLTFQVLLTQVFFPTFLSLFLFLVRQRLTLSHSEKIFMNHTVIRW